MTYRCETSVFVEWKPRKGRYNPRMCPMKIWVMEFKDDETFIRIRRPFEDKPRKKNAASQ